MQVASLGDQHPRLKRSPAGKRSTGTDNEAYIQIGGGGRAVRIRHHLHITSPATAGPQHVASSRSASPDRGTSSCRVAVPSGRSRQPAAGQYRTPTVAPASVAVSPCTAGTQ